MDNLELVEKYLKEWKLNKPDKDIYGDVISESEIKEEKDEEEK